MLEPLDDGEELGANAATLDRMLSGDIETQQASGRKCGMRKVVVFGSLNTDMSIECDRLPELGETVRGSGFVTVPGGKGGNQAVASARMGADTFMVGKVGNDPNGRELVSSLAMHGVVCMNVSATTRAATATAVVLRTKGNNHVILDVGANEKMTYEEVRAAIHGLRGLGNIFLTQLECDFDVTMKAISCAKRNGLYTVLNASPARELPDEIYPQLDLLCVNRTECAAISGICPEDDESAKEALRFFAGKGARDVIVTLGSEGSVALSHGKFVRIDPFPVDAVDSTGSGDAYLGEVVAHLAFGGTLKGGMVYGSAAGALCATKVGGQDTMPSWAEVEALAKDRVAELGPGA
ncbi:hypothetical protein HMPREF1008_01172 [Olsenella sp. oral taxon 809 str. F0356]|uniref:ribokinase n=1 Tax=Olsenella sp. oral taxon 809 TaxID=661086 RepID=UPI000231ED63|nr:ribokinase [Olsenella sp. oral taxon 809]EHF01548.1 hypothetical protein HMPREF1008_01172 [Olsenella sp. oral taxon 809 str. F0356]